MKTLAFLLLTISLVSSKWATPIEITSYVDPVRITKALFTDASSGVSHIAYCNSTDGALYYANLDDSILAKIYNLVRIFERDWTFLNRT